MVGVDTDNENSMGFDWCVRGTDSKLRRVTRINPLILLQNTYTEAFRVRVRVIFLLSGADVADFFPTTPMQPRFSIGRTLSRPVSMAAATLTMRDLLLGVKKP